MTDVNDIYTSNYLKADDLQGREVTVVIDREELVELDDGKKLCIYFRGKEKGLLLNKTNATNIASLYGPRTESWIGKPITIGMSWVDYQGKSTKAIRVRPEMPRSNGPAPDPQAPLQQHQHQPQQQAQSLQWAAPAHDLDDEIPF